MIRDTKSRALLETDSDRLLRYRRERQLFKDVNQIRSEIAQMKNAINNINNTIHEMKETTNGKT